MDWFHVALAFLLAAHSVGSFLLWLRLQALIEEIRMLTNVRAQDEAEKRHRGEMITLTRKSRGF